MVYLVIGIIVIVLVCIILWVVALLKSSLSKHAAKQASYVQHVKCPYCESNDTNRIKTGTKALYAYAFGLFGMGKIAKQWHCNNCNSDF